MTRPIQAAALVTAGAILGVTLVIACGDDDPGTADAQVDAQATCDCPDAEPPLDGRIVRIVDTRNPGAGEFPVAAAQCPDGALLLGGGCAADVSVAAELVLFRAGGNSGTSYSCEWRNRLGLTVDEATAWAVCLVPPESD